MKPTKEFPFLEGQRYHHDCERCGQGTYEERSLYDDWDGKLTCEVCQHRAPRYYAMDKELHYTPPAKD